MPDYRFFIPEDLIPNTTISIQEGEFHHLLHVMRVKPGDEIELINGKGQKARGLVEKIEKHQARALILDVENHPATQASLILAQAMPRMARLEYILEKATELGIDEIWLYPSEHSEKKEPSASQWQRMQQILISSLKQCGRLHLPKIAWKKPLKQWEPLTNALFGDVSQGAPLLISISLMDLKEPVVWMVGPESGFSEIEHQILKSQINAQGVSLHQNILRVDTAAISGLSVLSQLLLIKKSLN